MFVEKISLQSIKTKLNCYNKVNVWDVDLETVLGKIILTRKKKEE